MNFTRVFVSCHRPLREKTLGPRLELTLTGQGLLRFIEPKIFRSVTRYSISIVNMSKQDDVSTTGEILHRLDYPSVYKVNKPI